MTNNKSKKDPAKLLTENIKEVSSVFSTGLDTFFDDIRSGVDRIFSNYNKNIETNKKKNSDKIK